MKGINKRKNIAEGVPQERPAEMEVLISFPWGPVTGLKDRELQGSSDWAL